MNFLPIVAIAGVAGVGKDSLANAIQKACNHVAIVSLADGMKRLAGDLFGFGPKRLWGPSAERNALTKIGESDSDYAGTMLWAAQYSTRLAEFGVTEDRHLDRFTAWLNQFPRGSNTSARVILQTLGTEFGRGVSDNIWIDYKQQIARKLLHGGYTYTRDGGLQAAPGAYYNTVVTPDIRFRNEVLAERRERGQVVLIDRPDVDTSGAGTTHPSEAELGTVPPHWFDTRLVNNGSLENLTSDGTLAAVARRAQVVYAKIFTNPLPRSAR